MVDNDVEIKGSKTDNLAVGAKGGLIALILKGLSAVLGFANQIVLAKILGAQGVGEVVLAIAIVRISAQIAKFGMEETMMRFVPLYVDQQDESRLKGTIYFSLLWSFIMSIILLLIVLVSSKYISLDIFHEEGLMKLLPVIVLAIPAWVLRDVIGGVMRGYQDAFRGFIPISIVSPFIRIVVFLILILNGISTLYAIIAFIAGEFISAVVSTKFLLNKVKKMGKVKPRYENRKMLEVGYTIIFTSMVMLLYTQADIFILGMYKSTQEVGIYGWASKLAILIYFSMDAFAAVIPSLISSTHAIGNIKELRRIVSESTRWILSTAMPIILILILEGNFILKYFYGPEFEAGYIVLVILTLGQLVKASAGLIGVVLQMTGEHRIYMKINIIGAVLNVMLNIYLVPRYGMAGAAVATALCLSMIDITCIFIIKKKLSVITLAKGFEFDIIFISVVAIIYFFIKNSGFLVGYHLLLIISVTVYLWKSIANHDIPWQLLIPRHKER